jgi:OmpA-OmpF porin, OOP family
MTSDPPSSAVLRPVATQTSETPPAMTKQESEKPAMTSTKVMNRITFDFGSEGINAESKRTLDTIVVALKANPHWRIVIEGHTDAQGTPDYNRVLSERRAQAVEDYLEAAGIAPGRLRAAGFGASRPLAPNDARGNAVNRRVEIRRQ